MLGWSRNQRPQLCPFSHPCPREGQGEVEALSTLCQFLLPARAPCSPSTRLPPSQPPFPLTCSVKYGFVVASCNLVYFFSLSLFFFFNNRFEPVIQLIVSQSTGLVAMAQHESGEQETGPQKLLSRKSNFIIEKSSV